jgi:Protein of unknown function (DUF2946)
MARQGIRKTGLGRAILSIALAYSIFLRTLVPVAAMPLAGSALPDAMGVICHSAPDDAASSPDAPAHPADHNGSCPDCCLLRGVVLPAPLAVVLDVLSFPPARHAVASAPWYGEPTGPPSEAWSERHAQRGPPAI